MLYYVILYAPEIPSLNTWTQNDYLPIVFRQDPIYDPIPGRVAHQNQMVTGVRMAKFYREPSECPLNKVLRRVYARDSMCYLSGELKEKYVVFPWGFSRVSKELH